MVCDNYNHITVWSVDGRCLGRGAGVTHGHTKNFAYGMAIVPKIS